MTSFRLSVEFAHSTFSEKIDDAITNSDPNNTNYDYRADLSKEALWKAFTAIRKIIEDLAENQQK